MPSYIVIIIITDRSYTGDTVIISFPFCINIKKWNLRLLLTALHYSLCVRNRQCHTWTIISIKAWRNVEKSKKKKNKETWKIRSCPKHDRQPQKPQGQGKWLCNLNDNDERRVSNFPLNWQKWQTHHHHQFNKSRIDGC